MTGSGNVDDVAFLSYSRAMVDISDYNSDFKSASGLKAYKAKRKCERVLMTTKDLEIKDDFSTRYMINCLVFDMLSSLLSVIPEIDLDQLKQDVVLSMASQSLDSAYVIYSRVHDFLVESVVKSRLPLSLLAPFLPSQLRLHMTPALGLEWAGDLSQLVSMFKTRSSYLLEDYHSSNATRQRMFETMCAAIPFLLTGGDIDHEALSSTDDVQAAQVVREYQRVVVELEARIQHDTVLGIDRQLAPLAEEITRRGVNGWAKTAVFMSSKGPVKMALPDKAELTVKSEHLPLSTHLFAHRMFPAMVHSKWQLEDAMQWVALNCKDASLAMLLLNKVMVNKSQRCLQYARFMQHVSTMDEALRKLAVGSSGRGISAPFYVQEGHPQYVKSGFFLPTVLATFDEMRTANRIKSLKIGEVLIHRFATKYCAGADRSGLEGGKFLFVIPGKGGKAHVDSSGNCVERPLSGYNKYVFGTAAQLILGDYFPLGNGCYAVSLDREPMTIKQHSLLKMSLAVVNRNEGDVNLFSRFVNDSFFENEQNKAAWDGISPDCRREEKKIADQQYELDSAELGELFLSFVNRWSSILTTLTNVHSSAHFDLQDGHGPRRHCAEYMYFIRHHSSQLFPCTCKLATCPINLALLSLFLMATVLVEYSNRLSAREGSDLQWTHADFGVMSRVCAHVCQIYFDFGEHNIGSIRHIRIEPKDLIRWHDVPFFSKAPFTDLSKYGGRRGQMLAAGEWRHWPFLGPTTSWSHMVNHTVSYRAPPQLVQKFTWPTSSVAVGENFSPAENQVRKFLRDRKGFDLNLYAMDNIKIRQLVIKLNFDDISEVYQADPDIQLAPTFLPDEEPFLIQDW